MRAGVGAVGSNLLIPIVECELWTKQDSLNTKPNICKWTSIGSVVQLFTWHKFVELIKYLTFSSEGSSDNDNMEIMFS